jgi:hypothetical protein
VTDLGLTLRVALCEAALRDYAAKVSAEGVRDEPPRWVGLFQVEEATVFDRGVYLYTSWSFLNRHGVAHLPPGSKPAPRTSLRHLYGSWYSFEWRF